MPEKQGKTFYRKAEDFLKSQEIKAVVLLINNKYEKLRLYRGEFFLCHPHIGLLNKRPARYRRIVLGSHFIFCYYFLWPVSKNQIRALSTGLPS